MHFKASYHLLMDFAFDWVFVPTFSVGEGNSWINAIVSMDSFPLKWELIEISCLCLWWCNFSTMATIDMYHEQEKLTMKDTKLNFKTPLSSYVYRDCLIFQRRRKISSETPPAIRLKLLRQSAVFFSRLKSRWNKFSQGCLYPPHMTIFYSFHRFPYITWSKNHACFHISTRLFKQPQRLLESLEWDGSVHDLKSLLTRKCFVFVIFFSWFK